MIITLLILNFMLMLAAGVGVGIFLASRYPVKWQWWMMGGATFIGAQVFHIPFNMVVERTGILPTDWANWENLILVALFYGLSAGVFEEVGRYVTYRFLLPEARGWSAGMMVGAGHGGVEALAVSGVALLGVANATLFLYGDLEALIPAEDLDFVLSQVEAMKALAWYELVLGGVERLLAVTAHLAFSLIVMQVFLRGQLRWLGVAIGGHALLDMIAVIGPQRLTPLQTELALAVFAAGCLGLILFWRGQVGAAVVPVEKAPLPAVLGAAAVDLEVDDDKIEASRYQQD